MTVEGLLNWHTFRVTAKNKFYQRTYSVKVIAPNADSAIKACQEDYSGITDLIDWQARNIASGDVKVVHLV